MKQDDKKKKPPTFQRWVLITLLLDVCVVGAVLAYVVLPNGGATLTSLEVELPTIASAAVRMSSFFQANLWIAASAAVAISFLVGKGALDRILAPAIAVSLTALLIVGAATASGWTTQRQIADSLAAQTE